VGRERLSGLRNPLGKSMRKILSLLIGTLLAQAAVADVIVHNDTTCTADVDYTWWNTTCPGSSPAFSSHQTLAPGASVTAHQSDFGGYSFTVAPHAGHTGTPQCMDYTPGGTIQMSSVAEDGCGAAPSTNCWHIRLINNTFNRQTYGVTSNGIVVPAFTASIDPTNAYEVSICDTNWASYQAVIFNSDGGVNAFINGTYATNAGPPSVSDQSQHDLGSGSIYAGGTNAIPGASIGDNAIYQALSQMDQDLLRQLRSMSNTFSVLVTNSNFNTNINNVTNSTNVTVTNSTDVAGLSNLLAEIRRNQTNEGGIGWGGIHGITNGWYGTNWAVAQARALDALGDGYTSADSMETAIRAGPPADPGGGSDAALTMAFVGHTISFDPAVIFPGMPDVIKLVISWLMIVQMLLWMGDQYLGMIKELGKVELGGVPDVDIDVPLYGNAIGVGLALAVPAIFLAAWLSLWHFIFGADFNLFTLAGSAHATNPFGLIGGHSGAALYLLQEFFNLELVLSLLWARLTWYFAGGKIIMLMYGGFRFLFGK